MAGQRTLDNVLLIGNAAQPRVVIEKNKRKYSYCEIPARLQPRVLQSRSPIQSPAASKIVEVFKLLLVHCGVIDILVNKIESDHRGRFVNQIADDGNYKYPFGRELMVLFLAYHVEGDLLAALLSVDPEL